jgi:hypothetical protein
MPIPFGPFVEELFTEYANAMERWFDRSRRAIETARNGNYPFEQFAADMTDTWVDGTVATLYPLTILGGVAIQRRPPFPVVHFKLYTRVDTTRVFGVRDTTANIAAQNLRDAAGGPAAIPNGGGNITLTKPTATTIQVALANVAAYAVPAGLYVGNIMNTNTNTPVGRIELDLP